MTVMIHNALKIPTPRKIDNVGTAKDIITQIFTFVFVYSNFVPSTEEI